MSNRINGILQVPSDISSSANNNLNIKVNRLSGDFDASILSRIENLDMLEGNLFSCRNNYQEMANDPYEQKAPTHCGSFQYDFALIC